MRLSVHVLYTDTLLVTSSIGAIIYVHKPFLDGPSLFVEVLG